MYGLVADGVDRWVGWWEEGWALEVDWLGVGLLVTGWEDA